MAKRKEKKQPDNIPMAMEEVKAGRPPIEIDENEVKKLAEMQCTNEEIAHFFECSVDTIERRFLDILRQCRAKGSVSVKRALFLKATIDQELGAIIWWQKNFSGMSDKVESKVTATARVESKEIKETPIEQLNRIKEMIKDGQ